jgi:hypothetical protein
VACLHVTSEGVRDEQRGFKRIMNIKEHPNHKIYIQVLRKMSPEKRLLKAFELSEFTRQLFIHGLRKRFPNLSDEEFKKILLERLDKCHNRNY